MSHECTEERFLRDVADHVMTVIRDDGASRHIRFAKPGTGCMHFDLITWPGYLCYTGDMGTYVFSRLTDMFEFFRTDREYKKRHHGARLGVNFSYWGEKLQSIDRCDGYKNFSPAKFKANAMDFVDQHGLSGKLGHGLRDELNEAFEIADSGDANAAYSAILGIDIQRGHRGAKQAFPDFYEMSSDDYSFRFVWCCYALAWGIEVYDDAKAAAGKGVPA